ncbi:ParB/RepB/Spo0J family partition protein [Nitratireductor kimnyeongensis]
MVSVFQPRMLQGRLAEDECHIEELQAAIGHGEEPRMLDPITVWWGGDIYYVVDGHHRLTAYDRQKVTTDIPVEVFEGTLDQAMAHSAALNSKNRLPMRLEDKLNYAWRLVLVSSLSKRQIVDSCGVANGTVGEMRSVKAKLLEDPATTVEDLQSLSWKDARMNSRGVAAKELTCPEAAVRKRAERYVKSILRAVKDRPFVDPEAFAMALVMLDERLPSVLMQTDAWGDAFRETVEGLRNDLESARDLAALWDNEDDY